MTPAALLSLLIVAGAGCTEASRKNVRSWTYPPDFNYISAQELRSVMSAIAVEVGALDALLRTDGAVDIATRERVLHRLRALDAAAQRLGPGGWPSNHPRLTDNAERFQRDIARALVAAEQDPPQYFLAGRLSGSCVICHGTD